MHKNRFVFLGTGGSLGVPIIGCECAVCSSTDPCNKRLRPSGVLFVENKTIVIDAGPDFRQQMLACNCQHIDAIFFTHEHSDHTAGLDDIRPFFFKQGEIPIYAHNRVLKNLEKRFDYIFETENKYPGAPGVMPIEVINNQNILIANKEIIPVNVMHGNLQVFGFRFDNFAYLTDVKEVSEIEIEKLKGLDVLVVNALREESHPTHFNLQEALDFIKIVQPKKAYLTHISHVLGFHEEVQQKLPENVFLAYDNLIITI